LVIEEVGLFGIEDRWVNFGDHDNEAYKEDRDEYLEDVAAHAPLIENPVFTNEGSELAHNKIK
jgi:hypothetical protein